MLGNLNTAAQQTPMVVRSALPPPVPSVGTIATGGGTANAGTAGRNAGNVTISAGGAITALGAITASGSAGVLPATGWG